VIDKREFFKWTGQLYKRTSRVRTCVIELLTVIKSCVRELVEVIRVLGF
jgi:hypothetical protein